MEHIEVMAEAASFFDTAKGQNIWMTMISFLMSIVGFAKNGLPSFIDNIKIDLQQIVKGFGTPKSGDLHPHVTGPVYDYMTSDNFFFVGITMVFFSGFGATLFMWSIFFLLEILSATNILNF